MKFGQLADYFEQLEGVSSRLEITRILAEMLAKAESEEISAAVYMSLGSLCPPYEPIEFGLAEKMVLRAIVMAYEKTAEDVLKIYKEIGDVGLVAGRCHRLYVKGHLSIKDVYDRLMAIAQDNGQGSQERKVGALAELLRLVDGTGAKYVVRIIVGKLRLGFGEMTVLDALSWMVSGDKSFRESLEDAYNVAAGTGLLASKVKYSITNYQLPITNEEELAAVRKEVHKTKVHLGTPMIPALCQRLKSFDEMIAKMGEVAVEPKYDGTRVQVHWNRKNIKHQIANIKKKELLDHDKGKSGTDSRKDFEVKDGSFLRTYTRNLEENSSIFVELNTLGDHLKVDEIIFDCEAIGVDPKTGAWLPFQVTMTRKRKYEIAETLKNVPLKFMVFDLLYIKYQKANPSINSGRVIKNKKELVEGDIHRLPLSERRKMLERVIRGNSLLELAPQVVTDDPVVCRETHHKYLEEGLEGVVVKKWAGSYVPGRKGWNWVKIKEVETAKARLSDTIDCVVMGYYSGRGKRAGFGLGAFLVRVKSKNSEFKIQNSGEARTRNQKPETHYVTVTKIGTGLSDEQFRELKIRLEKLQVADKPEEYRVDKFLFPDVWVKPEMVVEIAADNITKSPNHTAGLALRFPRLVKFRDDKNPEQATTLEEVEELFKLQK